MKEHGVSAAKGIAEAVSKEHCPSARRESDGGVVCPVEA
jgi:hypothetical protein